MTHELNQEGVLTSGDVGAKAFALRIIEASMEPNFLEGDIIVVDPETPAVNGSLVVARLNHGEPVTFKKLVREADRVYLEPLNSHYQTIDITGKDVKICGVVRQVIRGCEEGL